MPLCFYCDTSHDSFNAPAGCTNPSNAGGAKKPARSVKKKSVAAKKKASPAPAVQEVKIDDDICPTCGTDLGAKRRKAEYMRGYMARKRAEERGDE